MVTDGDNPANPFASLSAYERRHLVTHLILAGELATAHRLLAVETAQQRNGWHQIKEAHGEVASFVADVNRIWREAEKAVQLQIAEGAWEFALGWPLRYALIASSINSLALNIPPGLMTTAVARGIWPAATALAYIRQMPDARQQLETALKILPDLPAESLLDAFSLVRDLFSGADQIRGLAALAPHLPAAREEALVQIGTLADASSRAELTALLVQHLAAAGQLSEALSLLEGLGGSHQTAGTLLQIAPQLAALDVAEQRRVLDLIRAMRSSVDQAAALVAILSFLATELRPVVRELAQKMKSRPAKIETLAALAELAAADQVSELMAQALSEVGEVGDGQERARLLALLSPHLSATQGKAAVTAASELGDPEARALAFAALASFLTRDQIEQSLQGLSEKSPTRTSWALRRLAPYAGGPEQERLLDMAKSLENRSIRGPLLMELAGLFSGRQRTQLEKAGLDAVTELRKPQQRAKTLAGVLPFLPEPLWDEAVAVVQRMQNDEGRALALAALAAQAPERFVDTLRETAGLIRSFAERAQALDSLAPRLSDSQVAETLANVLAIKDSEEQAWLLVSLAPFVPEAGRRRALERVSRVSADRARAQMLAQLVAYLPQEDLQRVFDLASGIKSEYSRARVLIAWAERAAPQGTSGLEEAAAQLEYDYGRALLLAATAQYVTGRQRENLVRKALRAAEAVWWLEDKVSLLAEMAGYISPARLARLLTAEAEKTVSPRTSIPAPLVWRRR